MWLYLFILSFCKKEGSRAFLDLEKWARRKSKKRPSKSEKSKLKSRRRKNLGHEKIVINHDKSSNKNLNQEKVGPEILKTHHQS